MATDLQTYREALALCRFCPMCKPAAEVANWTQIESHTTRARAMSLWRITEGIATWQPRDVELLYQSTLDSISQSWCILHLPVSAYILAARAQVYAAGLAPDHVARIARQAEPIPPVTRCTGVFFAAEAAELGMAQSYEPALRLLEQAGIVVAPLYASSGALAYALGNVDEARAQATAVVEWIWASGAELVIADGPQTLWALDRIYSGLGLALPAGVKTTSFAELLSERVSEGRWSPVRHQGQAILYHDSRAAALTASRMARAEAIQPGYRGDEKTLGEGRAYEAGRALVDAAGFRRVYTSWSRSLAKSSGADDGLWLTYPKLAAGLARQRLQQAKELGAELVVTDSVLCASHLRKVATAEDVTVRWLPELMAAS